MSHEPRTPAPTRLDAWHRLGAPVTGAVDAAQAITLGHLGGWRVRTVPLVAISETGARVPVLGKAVVLRDNPGVPGRVDALGVVGCGYAVVQNEDHVELLDSIARESGSSFDVAGTIDRGTIDGRRKVFVTMKLPGCVMVGGADKVDMVLAVVSTHDGTGSVTMMVTPVRVGSASTLGITFGAAPNLFRVRHTSGARKNIDQQAHEAVDRAFDYLEAFQEEADRLIGTPMTEAAFEDVVMRVLGPPPGAPANTVTRALNKVEGVMNLFTDKYAQDGVRGTAWAGLNAVVEWADHHSPTRGDDRDAVRARNALFVVATKERALRLMTHGPAR